MNKVIMIGRLTSDPDVRYTQSGKPVCNLRIAVRRVRKQEGGPEADFFTVVAWGRIAEIVRDYCNKGRRIAVVGRLQNRSWEKDGVTRYATEIIAEELELLAQPSMHAGQIAQDTDYNTPSEGFSETDSDFPFDNFDDNFDNNDDELPF